MQGVDHRHIQRELGDVVIHIHTPTVLSSTAVRLQWMVRGPDHVNYIYSKLSDLNIVNM